MPALALGNFTASESRGHWVPAASLCPDLGMVPSSEMRATPLSHLALAGPQEARQGRECSA